ncbi:MAG: tetratricopeptide repeat protein [Vicinamibacteria bacterium]|nr:tetratricopeptide repeat protein [Vicinamibacteria bacterium]
MAKPAPSRVPLALAGLIAVAVGVWFVFSGRQTPPPPPPAPPVTAPPVTAPPATPEPTPPAATPAPTARPKPKPSAAATPAVDTAAMVREAEAAFAAGRYDDAASLFEQAARLDPKNAAASASAVSLRRQFVIGPTRAENAKGGAVAAQGFDTSAVAAVKKAAENPASLEIVLSPSRVRVGDKYQMEIYLINEGKKTVKVKSVTAVHKDAGQKIGGVLPLIVADEVASRQRELIAAVKETCGSEQAWSLDIAVTAQNGDLYRASVTWK